MFEYLRKFPRHYWQFLSLTGLVCGMLLPWRLAYSDVMDFEKHEAIPVYGWWEIKDSFTSLSHASNYAVKFLEYRLLDGMMLLGALSLGIYTLGSLYQIIVRPTKLSNHFSFLLRITSVGSALILLPDHLSPMMNSKAFIGYYIIAITLFIGTQLERPPTVGNPA